MRHLQRPPYSGQRGQIGVVIRLETRTDNPSGQRAYTAGQPLDGLEDASTNLSLSGPLAIDAKFGKHEAILA